LALRVLHTADLHIGDRRFGRFDPALAVNTRLADQRNCLRHLAELAIAEHADAVVIAGDIYHSKSPTPAEEDVFAEFIASLSASDIHIFAIAGNHERPTARGRASPLTHIDTLGLRHFHLMTDPGLKTIELPAGKLCVIGIPWPLRRELAEVGLEGEVSDPATWDEYISRRLDSLVPQIPTNSTAILTSHLWTSEVAGRQPYSVRGEPVARASTLAREPFRYIALGHIHKNTVAWNSPPIIYSGGIDRGDFTEADHKKGVVLVEFDGAATAWRFIETPARQFISIEMDLSGFPQPVESVSERASSYTIAGAVVRIEVTQAKGDPPLEARSLRPKLDNPFFLQVVRKVGSKDGMPFSERVFTPLGALEEFIMRDPELAPFKDKLLELAAKLAEEVG